MPVKITSATNPRIKELLKVLRQPSKHKSLAVIEGKAEIEKALAAKGEVIAVYSCPDLMAQKPFPKALGKHSDMIFEVSLPVYEKISYGNRKDGLILVMKFKAQTIEELKVKPGGLYLILEHVEKPGNIGAILRSCDGAGVDGVILIGYQSSVYNVNVIRNSRGAVFTVGVYCSETDTVLKYCKDNGIATFAATPSSQKNYFELDLTSTSAIVLGAEDTGLSEKWIKQASDTCRIPMAGAIDSLNVSCAAAVLMYEAQRQRNMK